MKNFAGVGRYSVWVLFCFFLPFPSYSTSRVQCCQKIKSDLTSEMKGIPLTDQEINTDNFHVLTFHNVPGLPKEKVTKLQWCPLTRLTMCPIYLEQTGLTPAATTITISMLFHLKGAATWTMNYTATLPSFRNLTHNLCHQNTERSVHKRSPYTTSKKAGKINLINLMYEFYTLQLIKFSTLDHRLAYAPLPVP